MGGKGSGRKPIEDPCPECCEADGNVLCDVAYCTHPCHGPSAPEGGEGQ